MTTKLSGIKTVLFDLDNTLFDHNRVQSESLAEIYKKYRSILNGVPFDNFKEKYLINNEALWEKLTFGQITRRECRLHRFVHTLKDLNLNVSPAAEMTSSYFSIYIHRNYLVDGALSVIKSLFRKKYKLGIVSNGFIDIQENKIDRTGIRKYFNTIIMSDHVGVMKPHRDIFHAATKTIDCTPDECIFVGDSYTVDVIGALDAGLTAVWYNPFSSDSPKEDNRHFKSIVHLKELLTLL